jgi:hypothetical protein
MITEEMTSLAQKKAKCSMIVWGLTYLFLFPFLFFFLVPFIGANSINATFMNKLLSFIDFLPIFAMPLSFFLMCFSYSKTYYKIVRLCWLIPIFFFALALVIHVIWTLYNQKIIE